MWVVSKEEGTYGLKKLTYWESSSKKIPCYIYFLLIISLSFLDFDECKTAPCPSDHICNNTVGSYRCECPLGFVEDPSSQNPVNIICNGKKVKRLSRGRWRKSGKKFCMELRWYSVWFFYFYKYLSDNCYRRQFWVHFSVIQRFSALQRTPWKPDFKTKSLFHYKIFSYQTARFRYLLVSWPKCHQGLVYCSG